MKRLLLIWAMLLFCTGAFAQDTIVVQTLTFDSITNRRSVWVFPDSSLQCRKVLMYYTLKCDPATTADQYPCGEWDYLTYTMVYHHTKTLDSLQYNHKWFLIGQQAPDSAELLPDPVYDYFSRRLYSTATDQVLSEQSYTPSVSAGAAVLPFGTQELTRKVQYLWRAQELTAAGLAAGNIQRMSFEVPNAGFPIRELTVRIRNTSDTSLTQFVQGGFQTVYHSPWNPVTGTNILHFLQPFYWNGTSNIVIEFAYTNSQAGPSTEVSSSNCTFSSMVSAAGNQGFLHFKGNEYVWLPVDSLATLSGEITVMFRVNGDPAMQPQDGTLFEAVNAQNERVLNVHLPWSNSNVYWDAGRSGGSYDRINKAASAQDFKGRWNHWAFTKNSASGEMKIYLNGTLWHSGSAKTALMNGIAGFKIGATFWGGQMYHGLVDNFSIWKKELDPSQIAAAVNQDILPTHPDYPSLLHHLKFDEQDGFVALNKVNPSLNSGMIGVPLRESLADTSLYIVDETGAIRPVITFYSGTYVTHPDSVLITDTLAQQPVSLEFYQVSGHGVVPTDTVYGWRSGYSYHYLNGVKTDSVASPAGILYLNHPLYYYSEPFEKLIPYEIGRYITPYGINLSLGTNGTTWIYDVTDYRYLLADSVDLSAGNNQELIDLKFLFIEGEPAAEVLSVDNIWDNGYGSYYYKDLADNSRLAAKKLPLHPAAEGWKVKTRITGHGHNSNTGNYPHCCEWKDNTHYLLINGIQVKSWHVFKYHDCALNPVYPQGGTWPGAREGWCPGDMVTTGDWDITPWVSGDSVSIDYDITDVPANNQGMGWGNYVMAMQLVQYGQAAHQTDAEVYDVMAPSKYAYYSRMNPVCIEPVIVIRNAGSDTLRSLNIEYHVSGGRTLSFGWTGNLGFMQMERVTLPIDSASFWIGDGNLNFLVSLSNPNNTTDQYPANNQWVSPYRLADWVAGKFMIWLKTNNLPQENSYVIRDVYGNTVFTRDNLSANTVYKDTLDLPPGCYTFDLYDTGDDGLYYWAYTQQGSGYVNFRNMNNQVFKNFNAEFGASLHYAFTVGNILSIAQPGIVARFEVYPNPASGKVNVDVNGFSEPCTLTILNNMGELMDERQLESGWAADLSIDLENYVPGLYFVVLRSQLKLETRKLMVR